MRVLTASIILTIFSSAAGATTICHPHKTMQRILTEDYQATKEASGVIRPSSIMEVWVSDRTGDWFVTQTSLTGSSCIIAHGDDYNEPTPDAASPTSGDS